MKTGNTYAPGIEIKTWSGPQWSPVMKTGNTWKLDFNVDGVI